MIRSGITVLVDFWAGLHRYGMHIYGLYSYGRYSYGFVSLEIEEKYDLVRVYDGAGPCLLCSGHAAIEFGPLATKLFSRVWPTWLWLLISNGT